MVDFSPAMQPGWLARLVYFLPGFAHSAVMVFFVLSGYLVGGEVLRGLQGGTFDWYHYAVRRAARIYAGYLAALLVGGSLDWIGLHGLQAVQLYDRHGDFYTVITYPIAERLNLPTLAANLAFCQTILAPTFGSNGALWSLANEVWYYAIFPLALWPLCPGISPRARLVSGAGLVAALWFVGGEIVLYFSIWLLGVLPHALPRARLPAWWTAALFLGLLISARLYLFRGFAQWPVDLLVGSGFAVLLKALEPATRPAPGPATLHRFLAGFAYTVYLIHWPVALFFLALLHQALGLSDRLPFGPAAIAGTIVLTGLIYLCSWALSLISEAQTSRVRRWLLSLDPRSAASSP